MASISRDKNGTRRILFVAPDGRRPTIRLGKAFRTQRPEGIKSRVEQLLKKLEFLHRSMEADLGRVGCRFGQAPSARLASGRLDSQAPKQKAAATLGPFMEDLKCGVST